MGRRFWLFLGIVLLAPSASSPARAQGEGGPPAPDARPASPLDAPLPTGPIPLAPPDDPATAEAPPGPAEPRSVQASGTREDRPALPALTPAPSAGAKPAEVPPRAGRRPRPRADAAIERADAAPAGGDEPGPAGQFPIGKQSVAVTVEVQSPASMNLRQKARVRLIVRNVGNADATQVRVRDELPDGLKFVESKPEATVEGSALNWSIDRLAARTERVITLQVEPVKTGSFEHGASVVFQTGSGARTRVYQPKLKVELKASAEKVLKGHAVEFRVIVKNVGDGPARDVTVAAKLSGGLRHGSGQRASGEMVTEPIPELAPNQSEELDPLVARAIQAGTESCTVEARSPDVIVADEAEAARSVHSVTIVEPGLAIALSGAKQRCTETFAHYEVAVTNPGTAPARKVRITALVPTGARLVGIPRGAHYDSTSRRLQWSLDELEPGNKPRVLGFEVKVGDVGQYQFEAEAHGEGGLQTAKNTLVTDVIGMPDIRIEVGERQRVIDVDGKTIFFFRLRNLGTKKATNVRLSGSVSRNLAVKGGWDVPDGFHFAVDEKDGRQFVLQDDAGGGIKELGPGADLVMGLEVQVTAAEPKVATCHVQVTHDELPEPFEGMAGVKVLNPAPRTASAEKP